MDFQVMVNPLRCLENMSVCADGPVQDSGDKQKNAPVKINTYIYRREPVRKSTDSN